MLALKKDKQEEEKNQKVSSIKNEERIKAEESANIVKGTKVDEIPRSSSSKSKKSSRKEQKQNVELESLLDHFSFRMQINRVPKSKLFLTLFGSLSPEKLMSKADLAPYLKRSPFSYSPSEIEIISDFLLDSPTMPAKLIGEKLFKATDDWEVFSQEDENNFDKQLNQIISTNKADLKDSCKEHDKNNTGIISLEDFNTIIKELSIDFPPNIFKYILLLFYSNEMKLNQVPYRHFIKAYGVPIEDEDEEAEEEKAKVVRHYLGIMAQVMIQNKKGVADVFKSNDDGVVFAEEFVVGLRKLGLGDIEHDHIMIMLEALQYEETSEICVSIEEFEEILSHYGVSPVRNNEENNSSLENSVSHNKKSNLFDSENQEISDDFQDNKESSKNPEGKSSTAQNKNEDDMLGSEEHYEEDYDNDDFQ